MRSTTWIQVQIQRDFKKPVSKQNLAKSELLYNFDYGHIVSDAKN